MRSEVRSTSPRPQGRERPEAGGRVKAEDLPPPLPSSPTHAWIPLWAPPLRVALSARFTHNTCGRLVMNWACQLPARGAHDPWGSDFPAGQGAEPLGLQEPRAPLLPAFDEFPGRLCSLGWMVRTRRNERKQKRVKCLGERGMARGGDK